MRIILIHILNLISMRISMLNQKLEMILLMVGNPQVSAIFYENILELKPVEVSSTFAMFVMKNGVMLGLWSKYTVEPRVDVLPGATEICLAADSVDEIYESWGKKLVTIAQKPTDMDFGRTFLALDPDGHRIRVYKLRAK